MTDLRTMFQQDGFAIVRDFFTAAEMAEFDAAIARYVEEVVPQLPPDHVFHEAGGGIRSMNRLDEHDAFFAHFKQHPRFLQLVAEIFATDESQIISESLQFFGKPAYEGSVTAWHQDNGFQHYTPPESLMLWLALDDVDEANGCVVFGRGSHMLGTVPHRPSGVLGFSQTVKEPPDLTRFPEVKAVMRRGSVSLHHCNMFHRSGANHSARSRRALAVNFRTARAVSDPEARARVKAEVARLLQAEQAQ
ncbi:MAG: phytanoyl-CoA dioxygenase family protein [Blastocatellia bacterium]